jgi:hypothetical protein
MLIREKGLAGWDAFRAKAQHSNIQHPALTLAILWVPRPPSASPVLAALQAPHDSCTIAMSTHRDVHT